MLLVGNKKYILQKFVNEEELEKVVFDNYEQIFGPDAILLPKKLIKSSEGIGTIPDGFIVDIEAKKWYVVEVELSSHGIWAHIAPQISKQLIACMQSKTRMVLTSVIVEKVKCSPDLLEKFQEKGISEIDIWSFIESILTQPPTVGLPIDHVGEDLKQWATTLKNDVKLWTVRKLVDFDGNSEPMYEFPDEFAPTLDTSATGSSSNSITTYDVSLSDLIENAFLSIGQKLNMSYKPQGGEKKIFIGTILTDGEIEVDGKNFSSPSYAALHGMKLAGGSRSTVNGWTSWKTENGEYLATLREKYLSTKAKEIVAE